MNKHYAPEAIRIHLLPNSVLLCFDRIATRVRCTPSLSLGQALELFGIESAVHTYLTSYVAVATDVIVTQCEVRHFMVRDTLHDDRKRWSRWFYWHACSRSDARNASALQRRIVVTDAPIADATDRAVDATAYRHSECAGRDEGALNGACRIVTLTLAGAGAGRR